VHASVVLLGTSSTGRLLLLKLVISNKLTKYMYIVEECSREKLRVKFDIAYFIETKNLPSMKICDQF